MVPLSITTLQKAILMPEDDILDVKKGHPNPASINLMVNPFANIGKGKKKKKGKGK